MEQHALTPLFDPGQIVATPSALAALESSNVSALALLNRHIAGDWGTAGRWEDIEPRLTPCEIQGGATETSDDGKLNAIALLRGDGRRICSYYQLPSGATIWVISYPGDHTTIMLPNEY